ncbi:MAG: 7-carboxy-7-deazaguanine synthase [Candidatus Midichloriaceae bacterium]|jgi:7-carboxy-7-deazaguanine synthase
MFGKNEQLGVEKGDGNYLKIHSIFDTIQGEGPYAGHPAVFIRVSGCNLACKFCDTEFDSFDLLSVDEILQNIKGLNSKAKIIVITGGEPFRQNINKLCKLLILQSFKVQIESNGTLYAEIPDEVEIVCSPKIVNGQYIKIKEDILKRCIAIKFLVSSHISDYGCISELGQSKYNIPVYIQPIDEYNEEINENNIELAKSIVMENCAILSLQIHKIINIQ